MIADPSPLPLAHVGKVKMILSLAENEMKREMERETCQSKIVSSVCYSMKNSTANVKYITNTILTTRLSFFPLFH